MLKIWIWLSGLMILSLIAGPVIGAPAPAPKPVPAAVPKPAPVPMGPAPKQVYEAQCSFCHAPKPANSLPDLTAWIRLLYTSACPDVTVKLDESQRKAIKAYIDAEFKAAAQPKP